MSTRLAYRAACGDFAPDVLEWIKESFELWCRGEPIESALHLTRAQRIREHDAAMRDAAQLLKEKTPGLTAWRCAGYLASLIHYFEIRVMPVLKMNPARPLSDVDRAIYRILLTGHRGPRTQRKIFGLLN